MSKSPTEKKVELKKVQKDWSKGSIPWQFDAKDIETETKLIIIDVFEKI
jgi:hypothetical protein